MLLTAIISKNVGSEKFWVPEQLIERIVFLRIFGRLLGVSHFHNKCAEIKIKISCGLKSEKIFGFQKLFEHKENGLKGADVKTLGYSL